MVKPEVVAYLQANLKKHPIDELRRQLAQEGVGDVDFDDSLKAAMRAPAALAPGASFCQATSHEAKMGTLSPGTSIVRFISVPSLNFLSAIIRAPSLDKFFTLYEALDLSLTISQRAFKAVSNLKNLLLSVTITSFLSLLEKNKGTKIIFSSPYSAILTDNFICF